MTQILLTEFQFVKKDNMVSAKKKPIFSKSEGQEMPGDQNLDGLTVLRIGESSGR